MLDQIYPEVSRQVCEEVTFTLHIPRGGKTETIKITLTPKALKGIKAIASERRKSIHFVISRLMDEMLLEAEKFDIPIKKYLPRFMKERFG